MVAVNGELAVNFVPYENNDNCYGNRQKLSIDDNNDIVNENRQLTFLLVNCDNFCYL